VSEGWSHCNYRLAFASLALPSCPLPLQPRRLARLRRHFDFEILKNVVWRHMLYDEYFGLDTRVWAANALEDFELNEAGVRCGTHVCSSQTFEALCAQ
jgi:hypothetical protein